MGNVKQNEVFSPWTEVIARGGKEEKSMTVAERSPLDKGLHRGLVDNKHGLEIESRNPKSPLFSAQSFEALNLAPRPLLMPTSQPKVIKNT